MPLEVRNGNRRMKGRELASLLQNSGDLLQLKVLSLAENSIKELDALASAITSLEHLQELRLGSNELGTRV